MRIHACCDRLRARGAFVALGLVVVVLLGSALLGGAIDMILGGTTQLIDAIERLTRLVHGA